MNFRLFNKENKYILLFISLLILFSCKEYDSTLEPPDDLTVTAKIGVFSDPHYFDPSLGTTGTAFEEYISRDRKLIAESDAILNSTIAELILEDVDLVLIPGDLTKDGELQSHQKFSQHLQLLEATGIKVYVVPGNHDINNPHAMSYQGDNATPVANVSLEEFAQIYSDYGYSEAIAKDPNSLSYVAEPIEGLWLIGMDACIYDNNLFEGHPETGGAFKPETYAWIKSKIEEGVSNGKTLFGMMHHGLTEHFLGQKLLFTQFVVDDHETIRSEFAELGLKVVFTGHFHAQDIVKYQSGQDFIFDIETGSSVTWPSPYRIIELTSNGTLNITSKHITQINYDTDGKPFQVYSKDYLTSSIPGIINYISEFDLGLSESEIEQLKPIVTDAIIAHFAGDENPSQETLNEIQQLTESTNPTMQFIGTGLSFIWMDLSPADNDIRIDLKTGDVN